MKKEVQALIKRRRAKVVPYVFLSLVSVVCLAIVWLALSYFTTGAGREILQTSTLTPTITFTPAPPTPTPLASDTPENTPTVTATFGPSPTPTPITYTVNSGDTLFYIWGLYAEQGVDLCDLMLLNGITDPAFLGEGVTLIIPSAANPAPSATPVPADAVGIVQYFVCPGDTLDAIAAKFNSLGTDIARRNNITDPTTLQVGQILDVRVNLATPTPTATATFTPAPTTPPAATNTVTP
jgi:LysM repeat protein